MLLLYRQITIIGRLSKVLWLGVMGTMAWIIFAGLTHFNASRAFDFPPGAFHLTRDFLTGLGSAMVFAAYDYWGYGNICFLGDEIKDPGRNIPRALLLSIFFVACLYIVMNVCILAVVPWQEMVHMGQNNSGLYIVSVFMERIYGVRAARVVTALVLWTAFASVFSLMLSYSRVPYLRRRQKDRRQRCHCRAGRDSNHRPVPGADDRTDRPAHPRTQHAPAISHVAVSPASTACERRISLHSFCPAELAERSPLRGGDFAHRYCHLPDPSLETLCMAVCGRNSKLVGGIVTL